MYDNFHCTKANSAFVVYIAYAKSIPHGAVGYSVQCHSSKFCRRFVTVSRLWTTSFSVIDKYWGHSYIFNVEPPNLELLYVEQNIWNKFSQERSCAATSSNSYIYSCFCKQFICSSDRSAYSAAGNRKAERGLGIHRSLTDTWMWKNWDWNRAIYLMGIHKFKFLCSARMTASSMQRRGPDDTAYRDQASGNFRRSAGGENGYARKKIYPAHVIKLGFAPKTYPPWQYKYCKW